MKQNFYIAISSKITNCLLFSIITLILVRYTQFMPIQQVLFMINVIGATIAFVLLILLKKRKDDFKLRKIDLIFYSARGSISFGAMLLWIAAIKHVGVHEATALGYTSPLWVFLSASIVMKEKFNKLSLLAILASLVGVVIIFQPKAGNISFEGITFGIGSILLWVAYETICKKQTSDQYYMMQSFYVLLFTAIVTAPFAYLKWTAITGELWLVFAILGALCVANITAIFLAYSYAPMMVISPFSYMRLIFTAILTAIFFDQIPSKEVFIGAAIIIIANSLFAYVTSLKKKL